jgi:hypothetical protein
MIFWVVLKLEISYNRVIISFEDYYFCMDGGIFELEL